MPAQLLAELQALVDGGWFRDLDEVILDALRRFMESHPAELTEAFLREDAEWGLRGRDCPRSSSTDVNVIPSGKSFS